MKVYLWITRAILRVLPIFFFFLIFFLLINSIETYLLEGTGIQAFRFVEIILAAALIAKIILLVDHLPLINRFRKYPLAYGILWKTLFYWIVLLFIRLLVRFTPFLFKNGSHLDWDVNQFDHQMHWNLFLSIQAYYLMLLFIFVTFQELTYKIGIEKMRKLFFGK